MRSRTHDHVILKLHVSIAVVPKLFLSRNICGPYIFTAYHLENTLFQENSFYPISFDQKFGKPDCKCNINKMDVRNYNGHFSKLIREVHKNAGIY